VHLKCMYLGGQRDAVLSRPYLLYCQVTLHVSGVSHTYHQEYTNCSYNYWYKSWIWRGNVKIRFKKSMEEQLPHIVHGQIWPWKKWGSWSSMDFL